MRRNIVTRLSHRPKNVSVAPGSNRYLEPVLMQKAKDIFAYPPYPHKLVIHNWRFFVRAGKCATGPPVGAEFTKMNLKIMDFAKAFNDRTKPVFKEDIDLQVRVQVYFDNTFTYRLEPPPTAWFILRAVRKKRRETGLSKGFHICYITLEMVYEIAKMKQYSWKDVEVPRLEQRVRAIACQCRHMGICVLGVDTHSSPIKGLTPKQYEEQSEEYRTVHRQQYENLVQEQLQQAPLLDKLHRPNLNLLNYKQLEDSLANPDLLSQLWKATTPNRFYSHSNAELARRHLNVQGWFRDMTAEEMRMAFFNWQLPQKERHNQLENESTQQSYWSRDDSIR